MAGLLYTLAVISALPFAALYLLWRARRQPAYLNHWGERFGFLSAMPSPFGGPPGRTIWLHAVSVGETRAAQPLIAALRLRYPQIRILLTHMTPTGRATSEALFGDSVMRSYLPYDTPWAMRRFLRRFKPQLGLIMETELWPNLIAACQHEGIPLLLVNARLSERSAHRYARFPTLSHEALTGLAAIGAQSSEDATRLNSLGAPNCSVTGNMKFDIDPPPAQLALAGQLRARFRGRPVFLAASTREGEEILLLDAWRKVGAGDTALLIIVPRHPQRFDDVAKLINDRGMPMQRRSENGELRPATQIVLGDSMGEMFAWYAAADLAFIGGSLLDFGCQNLIEACAVGTPVLLGPSTHNFAEAASEALLCGAARSITNADQLVHEALRLLADAAARERMGHAGKEFANRHRGATQRTLQLILRYLEPALSNDSAENYSRSEFTD